jgi:dephospho-CoA kinase
MLRIGLTGGIGSGKSTVAAIFAAMGIPVFVSDEVARRLQNEDEELKLAMKHVFGTEMYDVDGNLDRAKLAAIVFADKEKLNQLNALVHPAVAKAFDLFCLKNTKAKFVIKESAILFELGLDKKLDRMIVVSAPDELRIARVRERDGTSETEIRKRMANQLSQEEKVKRANYVIKNDGQQMLIPQVLKLIEGLMN